MKHDDGAAVASLAAAPAQLRRDQRLWGAADDSVDVRRYRQMLAIRRFEELVLSLFDRGLLQGTTHCCIGQEADSVAVAECLDAGDHVFSNHRCHGHFLARCQDPEGLLAEMLGLPSGVCRGVGGSQHLCTADFKSNGILGGTLPVAAGVALGMQLAGDPGISVVFMGDGAFGEGVVYETLNLAALWKLPVIFVCEDNKYAISVEKVDSTSVPWNADRAAAYGIPGVLVERNDALEVFQAAGAAIARARRGEGPTLIEIKTDRYLGHFQGDPEVYRPKGETTELRKNDPIPVLAAQLRRMGLLDDAGEAAVAARVAGQVEAAYAFARASAYPQPEDALRHVFV